MRGTGRAPSAGSSYHNAALEDPEDELTDLKKRFHLLEGDRKAYYETSQWTIRQNKETVQAIRQENKQLRGMIASLQKGQSEAAAKTSVQNEITKMDNVVCELRKKYDVAQRASHAKEEELRVLQDKLREIEKDSEAARKAEDTPAVKQIRSLENRLDKAVIKFNEAQSIRKTYGQIVKRLEEERLGFDSQIQALERTIASKERDHEELFLMCRDANHARDVARAELARFEQTIDEERRNRERELQERRQEVKHKVELNQRMEQRRLEQTEQREKDAEHERQARKQAMTEASTREEEQAKRITSYEEAFRKIKEATGVSEINTVISKFLTQEETHSSLLALKQEAQARIDALNEEKAQLRARVEEIKYSTTGSLGSRRVLDEFESHLSDVNNKCERNKARYERVAKMLISVKAGIEHLADKLENIRIDQPSIPMSDDTVVDVLSQCELKMNRLMEVINVEEEVGGVGPDHAAAYDAKFSEADLPANNVRIRLPVGDGDDEEGWDQQDYFEEEVEDDDEVVDRVTMKKQASSIMEKATRKSRRRRPTRRTTSNASRGAFEGSTPAGSKYARGAASVGKKTEYE